MRLLICLMFSLSTGCATYVAGAVVWSMIDPVEAGHDLLFTLPVAIVAMVMPALLGLLGLLAIPGRDIEGAAPIVAQASPAPHPAPAPQPVRRPANPIHDDEFDLELAA